MLISGNMNKSKVKLTDKIFACWFSCVEVCRADLLEQIVQMLKRIALYTRERESSKFVW